MPRLEAVLFDLDGTLLDSAPDIRQALNKMLAEQGRRPATLDEVKSMLGDGMMELCRKALEATGGVQSDDLFPIVQTFIAHYRSLPPDPAQVFPGVRETLDALKKAGVKLGVCTNKQEAASKKILGALGLEPFFDFIAGGDTFMVHKPNPGHITGILDAIGASLGGTVLVGDGPNDVVASQRAGIPCLVVTHGYTEDYNSLEADIKIPNIDVLIEHIKTLGFTF